MQSLIAKSGWEGEFLHVKRWAGHGLSCKSLAQEGQFIFQIDPLLDQLWIPPISIATADRGEREARRARIDVAEAHQHSAECRRNRNKAKIRVCVVDERGKLGQFWRIFECESRGHLNRNRGG